MTSTIEQLEPKLIWQIFSGIAAVPRPSKREEKIRAHLRAFVERHGLVSSRKGNGGGIFVAQPAREAVAGVLCAYLEQIGLEHRELFEARRVVGGALVHHAAIRASSEHR